MAADRRDIKDLLQKKTFHTAFAHVTTDEGKMKKYPCKFLKASVCCAKLPDNGPEGTNHFVPLENYLLYHHLKPVQFLRHKCLENCQTSRVEKIFSHPSVEIVRAACLLSAQHQ